MPRGAGRKTGSAAAHEDAKSAGASRGRIGEGCMQHEPLGSSTACESVAAALRLHSGGPLLTAHDVHARNSARPCDVPRQRQAPPNPLLDPGPGSASARACKGGRAAARQRHRPHLQTAALQANCEPAPHQAALRWPGSPFAARAPRRAVGLARMAGAVRRGDGRAIPRCRRARSARRARAPPPLPGSRGAAAAAGAAAVVAGGRGLAHAGWAAAGAARPAGRGAAGAKRGREGDGGDRGGEGGQRRERLARQACARGPRRRVS